MNWQLVGSNFSIVDLKNVDESIEIVVFGKGFGEAILLKCDEDNFILIDSFINPDTKRPIVLDYLDSIDKEYSVIKTIIITHWHKDHIDGVSMIIESIPIKVQVVINPIMNNDKLLKFLSQKFYAKDEVFSEFNNILSMLYDKKVNRIIPSYDKIIYRKADDSVKLIALSPQDNELGEYIDSKILDGVSAKFDKDMNIININENLLSLVLVFKFNDISILLAGDLEKSNEPEIGWNAITNKYSYSKSDFYKVSHHGSSTGEHSDIWNKLLIDEPVSVLTTYNKGYKLPKDEDIVRICGKSKALYVIGEKNKKDDSLIKQLKNLIEDNEIYTISNKVGITRLIYHKNKIEYEFYGPVIEYKKEE